MKEEAIRKINSIGKVATILLTISKVLLIIGAIGVLIGTVVFAVIPREFVSIDMTGSAALRVDLSSLGISFTEEDRAAVEDSILNSGDTEIEVNSLGYALEQVAVEEEAIVLTGDATIHTIYLKDFMYMLIVALVYLAATFITLIFAGKMSKAFRDCQSPFEENVIRHMQNFGYALIPWALIQSVSESVLNSMMNGTLSISIRIDLAVVLVVIVAICLIQVFKYGAMLQQESDETL